MPLYQGARHKKGVIYYVSHYPTDLDYWLWSFTFWQGVQAKESAVDEIKIIVEDVVMSEDCGMIQSTLGNLQKHTKLCLEANGDNFPHLM